MTTTTKVFPAYCHYVQKALDELDEVYNFHNNEGFELAKLKDSETNEIVDVMVNLYVYSENKLETIRFKSEFEENRNNFSEEDIKCYFNEYQIDVVDLNKRIQAILLGTYKL
jgi:hypothetical protein